MSYEVHFIKTGVDRRFIPSQRKYTRIFNGIEKRYETTHHVHLKLLRWHFKTTFGRVNTGFNVYFHKESSTTKPNIYEYKMAMVT